MNWFIRMLASSSRKRTSAHKRAARLQARPRLESLENRLAPASVFVVPLSTPTDGAHFHLLGGLTGALMAAGTGGTVTIEPGTTPDPTQVNVNQPNITIQGDPNVPGSILAVYNLNVVANGVILTNLNLGTVQIGGGFSATAITKSLVQNITELGAAAGNGGSAITFNVITGTLRLDGNSNTGTGDLVANNTFTSLAPVILSATASAGDVISSNQFFGDLSSQIAIQVQDSGTGSLPTTVANNTITLAGAGSFGITVAQIGGVTGTNVLNNGINTNNLGQGLLITMNNALNVAIIVQGNDFHNDQLGIAVHGDGVNAAFNVDLGGGVLNSLGGNNFRGFTATGTATAAAIFLTNTPTGTNLPALQNLFSVTPTTVIDDRTHGNGTGTGNINVTTSLDQNHAFVQALYNELLGRTGTLAELNNWVGLLTAMGGGQAAVANGILKSTESIGRIVDSIYLRYLGRAADSAGRSGWIGFLQNGGTLEQMTSAFVTSAEYIGRINTDYVQSLYINVLGRVGSQTEVTNWNNNIQTLGLTGIANGFANSGEYRSNFVISYFMTFLHRTPSPTEVTNFAAMPGAILQLEADVLSSAEYFQNG
jgi:hypothetical protein